MYVFKTCSSIQTKPESFGQERRKTNKIDNINRINKKLRRGNICYRAQERERKKKVGQFFSITSL